MHHKVLEKITCNVFTRLAALVIVGSLGLGCTAVQSTPGVYPDTAPRYFGPGGISPLVGDSQGFAPVHSPPVAAGQVQQQRWVF
jgi:hypothetical protein